MRVPTDRPLEQWIRELIAEGKLYKFYKSPNWVSLRKRVMNHHHNECTRCKEKVPAVYSRATTVHHVREVKKFPHLALTLFIVDEQGKKTFLLLPLCNECHNEVHGRFSAGEKRPQFNVERW